MWFYIGLLIIASIVIAESLFTISCCECLLIGRYKFQAPQVYLDNLVNKSDVLYIQMLLLIKNWDIPKKINILISSTFVILTRVFHIIFPFVKYIQFNEISWIKNLSERLLSTQGSPLIKMERKSMIPTIKTNTNEEPVKQLSKKRNIEFGLQLNNETD